MLTNFPTAATETGYIPRRELNSMLRFPGGEKNLKISDCEKGCPSLLKKYTLS